MNAICAAHKPVSKVQRRPAGYDRFAGATAFPWPSHQIPSKATLANYRIQLLLLRANDFAFSSQRACWAAGSFTFAGSGRSLRALRRPTTGQCSRRKLCMMIARVGDFLKKALIPPVSDGLLRIIAPKSGSGQRQRWPAARNRPQGVPLHEEEKNCRKGANSLNPLNGLNCLNALKGSISVCRSSSLTAQAAFP